ncbi:MAG TPA: molybdenum cofactor biosynthesis protein MoaE [Planctomycetota bacterium]|jgi:molybdopterin synthase catalytic subunit|nr:molybdenum cofactor biosynthesis protein MoaE [Planctomycetota bacterium]
MFKVTTDPLSLDEAWAAVRRPDCGAVAVFLGTVRDHHEGRRVERLSYTAFSEMAEKEFARIAREARGRWPVGEIHVVHRVGRLEVGEASVIVAVSAPHRAEAFEACRFVIEELKKTAPIWKEEFYAGGGKAWVSGTGPEAR